jgi:hypothetical protein
MSSELGVSVGKLIVVWTIRFTIVKSFEGLNAQNSFGTVCRAGTVDAFAAHSGLIGSNQFFKPSNLTSLDEKPVQNSGVHPQGGPENS